MTDLADDPFVEASAVKSASEYVTSVAGAAALLQAALPASDAPCQFRRSAKASDPQSWYVQVITDTSERLIWVLTTLERRPGINLDHRAARIAFYNLSRLTRFDEELVFIARTNWVEGVKQLGSQLKLLHQQFEASAVWAKSYPPLTADVAEVTPTTQAAPSFDAVREALVERAGGALSLTAAAQRLDVSRQALHKRVVTNTALGMMRGKEIIIPTLQITEVEGKATILPGIGDVSKLFKEAEAGPWMALQFLVEHDPNLGATPVEALRAGRRRDVIAAARAHLRLDEG